MLDLNYKQNTALQWTNEKFKEEPAELTISKMKSLNWKKECRILKEEYALLPAEEPGWISKRLIHTGRDSIFSDTISAPNFILLEVISNS